MRLEDRARMGSDGSVSRVDLETRGAELGWGAVWGKAPLEPRPRELLAGPDERARV